MQPDLQADYEQEKQKQEESALKEVSIKKTVIDTWRGVFSLEAGQDATEAEVQDYASNLKKLRAKAMLAHVTKKWKAFWSRRKNIDDWTLTPDMTRMKNSKVINSVHI